MVNILGLEWKERRKSTFSVFPSDFIEPAIPDLPWRPSLFFNSDLTDPVLGFERIVPSLWSGSWRTIFCVLNPSVLPGLEVVSSLLPSQIRRSILTLYLDHALISPVPS